MSCLDFVAPTKQRRGEPPKLRSFRITLAQSVFRDYVLLSGNGTAQTSMAETMAGPSLSVVSFFSMFRQIFALIWFHDVSWISFSGYSNYNFPRSYSSRCLEQNLQATFESIHHSFVNGGHGIAPLSLVRQAPVQTVGETNTLKLTQLSCLFIFCA